MVTVINSDQNRVALKSKIAIVGNSNIKLYYYFENYILSVMQISIMGKMGRKTKLPKKITFTSPVRFH